MFFCWYEPFKEPVLIHILLYSFCGITGPSYVSPRDPGRWGFTKQKSQLPLICFFVGTNPSRNQFLFTFFCILFAGLRVLPMSVPVIPGGGVSQSKNHSCRWYVFLLVRTLQGTSSNHFCNAFRGGITRASFVCPRDPISGALQSKKAQLRWYVFLSTHPYKEQVLFGADQ